MKRFTKVLVGLTVVVLAGMGVGKVYADATPREPMQTGNAVVSRLVVLQQEGHRAYQQGTQQLSGWLEGISTNLDGGYLARVSLNARNSAGCDGE